MAESHCQLDGIQPENGFQSFVLLERDGKSICRVKCSEPPIVMPRWDITNFIRTTYLPTGLPSTRIRPAYEDRRQKREWAEFLGFLKQWKKAAIARTNRYELYILPPPEDQEFSHAVVSYLMPSTHTMLNSQKQVKSEIRSRNDRSQFTPPSKAFVDTCMQEMADSANCKIEDQYSPNCISRATVRDDHALLSRVEACSRSDRSAIVQRVPRKNYVSAHPSYLKTLGQSHSGWIFGAVAELVDNSRDAKATVLEISIDTIYCNTAGKEIPVLAVIDDGHGMSHEEILKMVSFGRKQPDTDDPDHIGRYGVGFKVANFVLSSLHPTFDEFVKPLHDFVEGPDNFIQLLHNFVVPKPRIVNGIFKCFNQHDRILERAILGTGAMRLGKDALVLTQSTDSRSIAFLSQSLNDGKDNIEIPIVTYRRRGQYMEVDMKVQSEALSKDNLKAITEFSPFNKYLIGEKAGLFKKSGTGTQIYIWNLDEWGSKYCLEWVNGMSGGSSFHQGDILISSRRARSRPGQMTREVPLDYSLRSYLEVIFLDPRMKISVQGSLVKSRPLARFLHNTSVENGVILGKPVQLILGRSQLDLELGNCGIFLYWHGRLIEAYKRVGSMIHNGEKSHGIIGVIDVTDLMNDGSGRVWVHNNKQGFEDCEPYAQLEEWLSKKVDEYLDNNVDKVHVKKAGAQHKPDHEWVQCNKCRKWRMLSSDFDSKTLPQEWFCYMKPFNGKCETPEQKVARGVITISTQRSGYNVKENPVDHEKELLVNARAQGKQDISSPTMQEDASPRPLKRLRRGLSRECKKN